jgi:O-antigen ligase
MALSRHSDLAWRLGIITLAALPLSMAIATRSSPLVVGLAAAFVGCAVILEGSAARTASAISLSFTSPLGLATTWFAIWTALSTLWSEFPLGSFRYLAEFWLTLATVAFLCHTVPDRLKQSMSDERATLAIVSGLICATIVAVHVQLEFTGLRAALGGNSEGYVFNRSMIALVVLTIPVLAGLRIFGSWTTASRAVLSIALGSALLRSSSASAVLGCVAAAGAYVAARVHARATFYILALVLVGSLLVAPFVGGIAKQWLPSSFHTTFGGAATEQRVNIWANFGGAVWLRPIVGHGFGVSEEVAPAGAGEEEGWSNHPHNAALQIWVELGGIGAALAAWLGLELIRRCQTLAARDRPAAAALVSAALAVSLVSHGAWQGWWVASTGTALVWFLSCRAHQPLREPVAAPEWIPAEAGSRTAFAYRILAVATPFLPIFVVALWYSGQTKPGVSAPETSVVRSHQMRVVPANAREVRLNVWVPQNSECTPDPTLQLSILGQPRGTADIVVDRVVAGPGEACDGRERTAYALTYTPPGTDQRAVDSFTVQQIRQEGAAQPAIHELLYTIHIEPPPPADEPPAMRSYDMRVVPATGRAEPLNIWTPRQPDCTPDRGMALSVRGRPKGSVEIAEEQVIAGPGDTCAGRQLTAYVLSYTPTTDPGTADSFSVVQVSNDGKVRHELVYTIRIEAPAVVRSDDERVVAATARRVPLKVWVARGADCSAETGMKLSILGDPRGRAELVAKRVIAGAGDPCEGRELTVHFLFYTPRRSAAGTVDTFTVQQVTPVRTAREVHEFRYMIRVEAP